MKTFWRLLIGMSLSAFALSGPSFAAVDSNLKPDDTEEISSVFREMGVVQRRAMPKGGRFLLSGFGSFDFSDGPYTNYVINLNPGYAISDFLEIYFNVGLKFISNPRSIVGLVQDWQLSDGTTAKLTMQETKSQYGIEVLWAPAYGKDSLGMQRVIRSDTFLKGGVAQTTFANGMTGMRFIGGLGKTFFINRNVGVRFCVDYAYLESVIKSTKAFRGMTVLETGLMYYF